MSKINQVQVDETTYDIEDKNVPSWARQENKPTYSYSEIQNTPNLSNVATSGNYNDLSNKPTIPDVSNFITKDVDDLTYYYKKNETYTKTEVDNKLSSVYKYKGTKESYSQLPSSNLNIGDVWNIETADSEHGIKAGDNVAWNGTSWDVLAGTIDLSNYQTKIDSSHKLASDLVDDTNQTNKFVTASEKTNWNNKENSSNKVTSISSSSTDTQYPSAKCVYDAINSSSGGGIDEIVVISAENSVITETEDGFEIENQQLHDLLIGEEDSDTNEMVFKEFKLLFANTGIEDLDKLSLSYSTNIDSNTSRYLTFLYDNSEIDSYLFSIDEEDSNSNVVYMTDPEYTFLANLDNVLAKDNTTSFTPTSDYNPATKKYVDDSISLGSTKTFLGELSDYSTEQTALDITNLKKGVYHIASSLNGNTPSNFYFKITINETNYYKSFDFSSRGVAGSTLIKMVIPETLQVGSKVYFYTDYLLNSSSKEVGFSSYIFNITNNGITFDKGKNTKLEYLLNTNEAQTISGEKTFSTIPKQSSTTAPTQDVQFTNKKYVDDSITTQIGNINTILATLTTPSSVSE